jgi:hypothetical protein
MTDEELAENERMWAEENGKGQVIPTDSSGELRGAGISSAGIESDLGALADDSAPPDVGGGDLGAAVPAAGGAPAPAAVPPAA